MQQQTDSYRQAQPDLLFATHSSTNNIPRVVQGMSKKNQAGAPEQQQNVSTIYVAAPVACGMWHVSVCSVGVCVCVAVVQVLCSVSVCKSEAN